MTRILLCIHFFAVATFSRAQTNDFVVLNTGGHQALVRNLTVTKDKKIIISAGNDKVIRFWDIAKGQLIDELYGQLGEGNEGKIFTLALSPDNRFLAVGGWLQDGAEGTIRLYNFPTRRLIGILTGHTNAVYKVSFSNDSRHLISGSGDKTIRVWSLPAEGDTSKPTSIRTFQGHEKAIYDVAMYGDRVVSASYDRSVRLWRLTDEKWIATHNLTKEADAVAFSPDGKTIISGDKDSKLIFYDTDLREKQTINNLTAPSTVAFSPDGKRILCGTSGGERACNVYQYTPDGWQRQISFKGHDNTVLAAAWIDNQLVATAGGTTNEILTWNLKGSIINHMVGQGRPIWAVSIGGNQVGFATTFTAGNGLSAPTTYFDLLDRQLKQDADSAQFAYPLTTYKKFYLRTVEANGFDAAILELRRGKKIVTRITRDATNGYSHSCYSFGPDKLIFSGDVNGTIHAYTFSGKPLSEFIGHLGPIWGLAISKSGKWLISSGGDQVIKLWSLEAVGLQKQIEPLLTLFIGQDREWVVWSSAGYYDASKRGERYIHWLTNQGDKQMPNLSSRALMRQKYFKPKYITRLIETRSLSEAQKALSDIDPKPVLTWRSPNRRFSDSAYYKVDVAVNSGTPIHSIEILRNNKVVYSTLTGKLNKTQPVFPYVVPLQPGDNKIQVRVRNDLDEAISEERVINYSYPVEEVSKPILYILAIGVSTYKDPSIRLKYADLDAKALVDTFQRQKGGIYKDVIAKPIINDSATAIRIKIELSELGRKVKPNDLVIISLAGHGVNINDYFYFLPYDVDKREIAATALKHSEFTDVLNRLPCKIIMLVDACHAGGLAASGFRAGIALPDVGQLATGKAGVVVMNGSTSESESEESDALQHGVFTGAILEGFSGKAVNRQARQKTMDISFDDLDRYVTDRVLQLTNNRQKPNTSKGGNIENKWPIYRLH